MFRYILALLFVYLIFFTSTNGLDCTTSKQEWLTLRYGLSVNFIGRSHSGKFYLVYYIFLGLNTNICSVSDTRSCCDSGMEQEMLILARQQLMQLSNSWIQAAGQMRNDSTMLDCK